MTGQPETSGALGQGEGPDAPDERHRRRGGRWRLDELADIDEVAILRAVAGDDVPLTFGERFLAVSELRRRGMSYLQIAAHLHIDDHQVYRDLHRAGMVVTSVEVVT